jgi:excisionase family DNA binding protein
MPNDMLTINEAAAALGVTADAVRQAIRRGRLRAERRRRLVESRRILIDAADLDRYRAEVEARRQSAE